MSSHHVVKDFQEPALLIANGEYCSSDLLDQLLGWSPVVVALDDAFPRLVSLGKKVDYWLGDFDFINPEEFVAKSGQDQVRIIHRTDQEITDFEKGILFLIDLGVKTIHIAWATGRRLDHLLSNLHVLSKYKDSVQLILFDDYGKSYFLPTFFEKWYPKGTILSLIPLSQAEKVQTKGLVYPLAKEDLNWNSKISTSNEAQKDGFVSIQHTSGNLLLIEATDLKIRSREK